MSAVQGRSGYDFGGFRLDPTSRQLIDRSDGRVVPLASRAFDVLLYLVEHAGDLTSRDELLRAVWPHTVVEENNLSQCIAAIRRGLGERAGENKYVVTIPGRGFRFVAQVIGVGAGSPDEPVSAPTLKPKRVFMRRPWVIAVVGSIALAFAGAAYFLWPQQASPPRIHTLAVLPFKAVAPTGQNPSLQYGMAQTLIQRLQGIDGMVVQPFSSVGRFGGQDQDVRSAARELAVGSVLEGTIQRDGDRLRVTARLLNAESGREMWTQDFQEDFSDIFRVQDAIATRVATALTLQLNPQARQQLSRRYTNDAEAYQLYLHGLFQRSKTDEAAFVRAIEFFEQAIARDPDYPLPYVGLADSYGVLGVFGARAPQEVFPIAHAAVSKALQLDSELGEAHASLAHIKVRYQHDLVGAEREYLRAIALAPDYALAHLWYGHFLAERGKFEAGLERLRHAQTLEPLFLTSSTNIGLFYYYMRRYDDAIEQLRGVLSTDPTRDPARSYLGRAYLRKGNYAAAIEEFQRSKTLTVGSYADLASAYALAGRRQDAIQELNRIMAVRRARYVPADEIAMIHVSLGNIDEAFEWFDVGFIEHAQFPFFAVDPALDELRDDPRMVALLARMRAAERAGATSR